MTQICCKSAPLVQVLFISFLSVFSLSGCSSLEENRISSLITTGTIKVSDSSISGADFEVILPTLWGNGKDSDEPVDRKWFVNEILVQTRKCIHTQNKFQIISESSEFAHAEDIAMIAEREYFVHHVHIACSRPL